MRSGHGWHGLRQRSTRWRMGVLALVFGILFSAVAGVELLRERAGLDRELNEAMQSLRVGLSTTLEATEREMLSIASLMAADPEVQTYMKRARALVEQEGGGAGGEQTARLREEFARSMELRRGSRWSQELTASQVEFHLKPGVVNFLRVRTPRRFGDALQDERPMAAAVHALDLPLSGFEVGRMYAGLRGLHPLFARDEQGETYALGSVEASIALRDLLPHVALRFGAEFVATLDAATVEQVMWEGDIRGGLSYAASCGCYVDAPEQPLGHALFEALHDPSSVAGQGYRLNQLQGRWYGITQVDLGRAGTLGSLPAEKSAARIFIFADRSDLVGEYRSARLRAISVLLLGYLLTMGVTWLVLRRIAATGAELETAQRFRSALFQLAPDSVLVTDRKGTLIEVNPHFCKVTGYAPEEVLGRNASILQSGLTPDSVYQELWSTLLSGREWRGDLQNRRRDGSLYWEAHAIVPICDAHGEVTHFVSFQRDISERHEMERALSASERLYRSIHDNVQEAIYVVHVEPDGSFRFLGNNPRHRQATGLGPERIGGARPHDVLPQEVADAACENFRRCIEAGETIRFEEELDLPSGRCYWMSALTPVRGDGGRIELIVGLAVDATEQKRIESELRRLATTDVLTGLANRRHFLERAGQELERVRRYASPSAFIMLDVDYFKRINDTWGHATGDVVLRLLAQVLNEAVRNTDVVGRLGGEEFGVLLPETGLEAASALAERLREAVLERTIEVGEGELRFSVSFGVTVLHANDESVDMPMARADAALYAAKFAGRNQVKTRER